MNTNARIRRFEDRVQGSSESSATPSMSEVCREAIVARCPDMERICPRGVDLAGEQAAALHGSVNGHAVELAGNRQPTYFREQLRGDRALTGEDIARLAVQAPADLVAWVRPLVLALADGAPDETGEMLQEIAASLGLAIAPMTPATIEVSRAIGRTAPAGAALVQAHADAVSPDSPGGILMTMDELRVLRHAARAARQAAEDAESAVRRAELQFPGPR